jgi:integrase
MDKGLRYVLECSRALFNYAAKRRHLPPYADNPFRILEIEHIPIDQARPIVLFDAEQEKAFLESCDDWQFPLFLLLSLTGIRPGELCHLLLPEDIDLNTRLLRVRNKPRLGWQIKTRNERDIPLVPVLVEVLRLHIACREAGPLFRRRRWSESSAKGLTKLDAVALEKELAHRISADEIQLGQAASRRRRLQLARKLWRELGAVKTDLIRTEFMRLTGKIGLPTYTAPKLLRHQFATALQEGRVDPLIRNQLMGHAAAGERSAGHGLGMTAVYTHSRPEICRQQLEDALANRPAVAVAKAWLARHSGPCPR